MGFAERDCLWSYQHQNTECANFQVCRPMQGKPHPLFMMTKPDAAVGEAFHENKHKQKSKDLEIQSLIFFAMYMWLWKDFPCPSSCFLQGLFGERICTCVLGLSAALPPVLPSCVDPEVQMCIYFASRDGNPKYNISSSLVKSSQKTAVIFCIWSRSSATSVASVTNWICSRRYLVTESQGLIKQYLYMSCSEFYKYIETKM